MGNHHKMVRHLLLLSLTTAVSGFDWTSLSDATLTASSQGNSLYGVNNILRTSDRYIWGSETNSGWIQLKFPSAVTIRGFRTKTYQWTTFKNFQFEKSNDNGASWQTVIEGEGENQSNTDEWQEFLFLDSVSSNLFRLNMLENWGDPNLYVKQLELLQDTPNLCGAGLKNCGTGCVARSTQCNETCDERTHCKLDVVTGRNIENWNNICVETHLLDPTSDFQECNGFCTPRDENCDCTWGFCRGEDGYCLDTFRNQGVKTCDGDDGCIPQASKCGGKCTEDECENEDGTCSRVVAEANTAFSPFTLLVGRCDGRCQPPVGAEPCHGKCEIRFGDVDQGPGTVFRGELNSAGRCVYSDDHPIVFLD